MKNHLRQIVRKVSPNSSFRRYFSKTKGKSKKCVPCKTLHNSKARFTTSHCRWWTTTSTASSTCRSITLNNLISWTICNSIKTLAEIPRSVSRTCSRKRRWRRARGCPRASNSIIAKLQLERTAIPELRKRAGVVTDWVRMPSAITWAGLTTRMFQLTNRSSPWGMFPTQVSSCITRILKNPHRRGWEIRMVRQQTTNVSFRAQTSRADNRLSKQRSCQTFAEWIHLLMNLGWLIVGLKQAPR